MIKILLRNHLGFASKSEMLEILRDPIQQQVREHIREAFKPRKPAALGNWWRDLDGEMERIIDERLRSASLDIKKKAVEAAREEVAGWVGEERFIEVLIARIKRKQL